MYVNGEPLKISFESRRDLTGRKTEEHSRERVERRCEEGVLFTLHSGKVLTQKERETNRMRIPLYLERGAERASLLTMTPPTHAWTRRRCVGASSEGKWTQCLGEGTTLSSYGISIMIIKFLDHSRLAKTVSSQV